MRRIIFVFLLAGCVGAMPDSPNLDVLSSPNSDYNIAYWAHDTDAAAPVRIYIEGDGHAFDASGRPTGNPTPRGTLVRDLAMRDTSPNVVYMARPCQFVMSPACTVHDWTDGRFSEKNIQVMSDAVRRVARGRPVILIGYSGGAMISGLIIEQNPNLNVREWITIAGVLNHSDWTEYFGDAPLAGSLNLNGLPRVSARHFVASNDSVVPRALSLLWTGGENMIIVPKSTHNKFPNLNIDKI